MQTFRFLIPLSLAFFVSCGNTGEKSPKGGPVVISACGDGVVTSGETCDTAILLGPGACPTTCEQQTSCSGSTLVGDAASCTAKCEVQVIDSCGDDDGCCPEGCDDTSDSDCSVTCGDDVVDAGETCDGNCESCENTSCRVATSTGAASSCSLECIYEEIVACEDGDGCCPTGCQDQDSDCSDTCGDGILVAGEVCDGDCPASCDDGNACTVDNRSGSDELCNVVCFYQDITACQNGDGCCAPGCTLENDNDCACVPTTCAALGATCGSVSDGCGGTLSCGTCSGGDTCTDNKCGAVAAIGEPCTTAAQCAAGTCANNGDFPSGYCTNECDGDNDCAVGSNCVTLEGYGQGICAKNCQADNECRGGAYTCYNADGAGTEECMPFPGGNSPLGGACTGLPDCDSSNGMCVPDTNVGFPGGYCTSECYFNGACPFESVCLTNPDGPGFCVPECMSNSECRTGYECKELGNDVTGETVGGCLGI